jgi:hypothetical protein
MTNLGAMNTYSYSSVLSGSSGKIYVPVAANMVMYSQLEHISGFAASEHQHGVAIDKVQILNRLIEHLSSMKHTQPKTVSKENITLDEKQVDALIKDYQAKIQDTLALAKAIPYATGGAPNLASCAMVDLTA